MQFSTIFLALASIYTVSAAKCNADNCARQATGTYDGLYSTRMASCSAFQQCTVTPTPATSTVTVTAALSTAVTQCPGTVPVFASSCNPSRYASACACAGITQALTTLDQSTITTYVTVANPGEATDAPLKP